MTNDASRAFASKSKLAQAAVLIAGVTANVLLAWMLFSAAYLGGVETAVAPEEAGPNAELAILGVLPDGPAAEAGIRPNDRIISLVNTATGGELSDQLTPENAAAFIAESGGQSVTIEYLRRGERMEATLAPTTPAVPDGEADERPRVGVVMGLVETVRYPVHRALAQGFTDTYQGLGAIVVGVSTLIAGAVTGTADFSQVAGPVGIAGLAGEASRFGFSALLIFTAFISLNLAIINLLPLPALDGGRLVMVAIETVRRRPIRPSVVRAVNTVGFLLILLLMVVVTWNDILRL